MRRIWFVLILLAVAGCVRSGAETALSPGQTLPGTLGAEGREEFFVELEANSFVFAEVEQVDFDARVTLLDPGGNIVAAYDGPARGAEPVQFETRSDGRYTLRVEGSEDQSGSFSITLRRVEPLATDPKQRLDQLLSAFSGNDTPGAVVAVIRDGKVVHHQAVGMANLTYDIPFRRETVSNIGSVSKQFTAFAVLNLVASDLLSLDDDVRDYFPELPDLGQVVTVRQLLSHSNGYREFLNLLYMAGVRLDNGDFIDRQEVLRILKRQPRLQDAPGSRYNYNNTAYSLAALLVEKLTGTPFQVWMQENVFSPLDMSSTRIRSHTGEIIPNAAEGYVFADEAPFRIGIDLGGGGGATMGPGGIYSTIDDLARWIGNLNSGEVGGTDLIAEMTTPQIEMPGQDRYYGLGLIIDKQRGLSRVWHNGADVAHRAELLFFPEINAGVIALSNNGAFDSSMAREVASAFFDEDMEPRDTPDAEAAPSKPEAPADIDISAFDQFVGQYEMNDYPGVVIIISMDEDQLYLQSPGGDRQPVTPISPTSVGLGPDQRVEFNVDGDGVVESLTIAGENELIATRLEAWTPGPADLAEYAGRYFSSELDTIYTIEMEEDRLVLRHRRLEDVELTPKVRDAFNASNAVSEIRFVRNDAGSISGLMASNVRTLDVWFERQD